MNFNPPIILPPVLIVKCDTSLEAPYVLLKAKYKLLPEYGLKKIWSFEVVKDPLLFFQGCIVKGDGLNIQPFTYTIQNGETISEVKIWRNRVYITHSMGNIFEYMMNRPTTILPPIVNEILAGRDPEKQYHFKIKDVETPVVRQQIIPPPPPTEIRRAPLSSPVLQPSVRGDIDDITTIVIDDSKNKINVPRIPTHVFHTFVELAIQKKEECPITMDLLTKENVSCPPCGHLFTFDALKRVLSETGKCPFCRKKTNVDEIQKW